MVEHLFQSHNSGVISDNEHGWLNIVDIFRPFALRLLLVSATNNINEPCLRSLQFHNVPRLGEFNVQQVRVLQRLVLFLNHFETEKINDRLQ